MAPRNPAPRVWQKKGGADSRRTGPDDSPDTSQDAETQEREEKEHEDHQVSFRRRTSSLPIFDRSRLEIRPERKGGGGDSRKANSKSELSEVLSRRRRIVEREDAAQATAQPRLEKEVSPEPVGPSASESRTPRPPIRPPAASSPFVPWKPPAGSADKGKMQRLENEIKELSAKTGQAEAQREQLEQDIENLRAQMSEGCSESRLRAAMTRTGVTTDELLAAIQGVEAVLGEAKRELQTRQTRERRAAYEELHSAMGKGEEALLQAAIDEARRVGGIDDDIEKAVDKLRDLQAMTEEQRNAKKEREHEAECKKRAFILVKRDNVTELQELLATFEGLKWQAWKDHASRTLLQCAQSVRSTKVQRYLEPILKPAPPKPRHIAPRFSVNYLLQAPELNQLRPTTRSSACSTSPEVSAALGAMDQVCRELSTEEHAVEDTTSTALNTIAQPAVAGNDLLKEMHDSCSAGPPETTPEVPSPAPPPALENEAELRLTAFRAVVKDDTATLAEVITVVPQSMWEAWTNKGGKDLVTLSEERGSVAAYSMLAKALGLLKERAREAFEEREVVWVMFTGDVQPRQATVQEDTPPEADTILLEFWVGDDPPTRVERDFVLKSAL